jgi:hypothetical protein
MKFVCVSCDEAMKIQGTRGPEEGSLAVTFGCPACGRQIALLTNPMETQIVRALDVKVGGDRQAADPMGFVRSTLASRREEPSAAGPPGSTGSACPFTSIANAAFERQAEERGAIWTEEAARRLNAIPGAVRSWAQKGIEQHAREKGYPTITIEVMEEARARFGM